MTTFPASPVYQPLVLGQRFPPIPHPPTGVDVLPFSVFVPSGICVPVDETGDMIKPDEHYVEHDGLGVATVALLSHKKDHHSLVNRYKRHNTPTKKDPSARNTWWDTWDETESVRKKNYDQRLPPAERLSIAAKDFKEGRPWPATDMGISQFWGQFHVHIGLSVPPKNPNQKGCGDDDAEDSEVEDMGQPVPNPPQSRNLEVKVSTKPNKKAKLHRPFNPDNPKTERFLDDPETNVKIFLSSHFSKRGLLWSRQRCLAFPILLRFFLSYLIRCKTFSEKDIDASLRRAVAVAQCAETELPKTGEIAQSLPNGVGGAFTSLWGPRLSHYQEPEVQDPAIAQNVLAQEMVHEGMRKAVEAEQARIGEAIAIRKQEEARQKEEEERGREQQARLALERAPELDEQLAVSNVDVVTVADSEVNGGDDEVGSDDEVAEDMGDEAEEVPQSGGESGAWPSPGAERGTWGGNGSDVSEEEVDPWAVPLPALVSMLGPTALPLTHRTGIVERSTRRIKEVIPPATRRPCKKSSDTSAEAVEEDLAVRFARVVLEPWPLEHLSGHSQIEPPTILPSSHGKVDLGTVPSPDVEGHAPLRDSITILLDSKAVPMLENALGMGLGATWTQIKRDEGATGKKGKGKITPFWYMEGLVHQIPSFWTDGTDESEEEDGRRG